MDYKTNPLTILLAVLITAIVAGGGFLVWQNQLKKIPTPEVKETETAESNLTQNDAGKNTPSSSQKQVYSVYAEITAVESSRMRLTVKNLNFRPEYPELTVNKAIRIIYSSQTRFAEPDGSGIGEEIVSPDLAIGKKVYINGTLELPSYRLTAENIIIE